jgi:hypothetical protein
LRKVILGKQDVFTSNESWRFIDANHEIEDTTYPFDAPEKINLEELYINKMDANFIGVKVGDVNGTAEVSANRTTAENRSAAVEWTYADVSYKAGELVTMNIYADRAQTILGTQLQIAYGSGLALQSVTSDYLTIKDHHYHNTATEVALSIDAITGLAIDESNAIITLTFSANTQGRLSDAISLSNNMEAEVYHSATDIEMIYLVARGSDAGSDMTNNLSLDQNMPNPFQEETMISYYLPKDGTATLSFYDINGRLLYNASEIRSAGTHTITITKAELNTTGIIYYTLDTDGQSITKKMLIIE